MPEPWSNLTLTSSHLYSVTREQHQICRAAARVEMKGLAGMASALIRVNDLPPTAVEDSRAGIAITFHRAAYQRSIWAFSPPKHCILHQPMLMWNPTASCRTGGDSTPNQQRFHGAAPGHIQHWVSRWAGTQDTLMSHGASFQEPQSQMPSNCSSLGRAVICLIPLLLM